MNENVILSEKEIKIELTNMLSEVDKYMAKNQLQYTIFSGTLLGAIRHGGFIPWDDDIDIAMIRPEYEKLLALLKQDSSINGDMTAIGYELGNGELPYIKIINKKIQTEEYLSPYSTEQGFLWVDIFPLDGTPDENIEEYYKKIKKLETTYLEKRINVHQWIMNDKMNNSFVTRMIYNMRWLFVNLDSVTEEYINLAKKYDVKMNKKITNNLWGVGYREAFPAKIMAEMVDYRFENITVKGIKEAGVWLSIRYGDYMKLPPESERINHGLKAWRVKE